MLTALPLALPFQLGQTPFFIPSMVRVSWRVPKTSISFNSDFYYFHE